MRTVVVEPTFDGVAVLGLIVVIRIVLSFALEVEIDGRWPWSQRRDAAPRLTERSARQPGGQGVEERAGSASTASP